MRSLILVLPRVQTNQASLHGLPKRHCNALGAANPRAGSIEVSSFVDSFLKTWTKDNPHLKASELADILATANSVKASLLQPPSRERRTPPSPHTRPLPIRRQLNSTATRTADSPTLRKARAIVKSAQKEASERNRIRFQNPRLNSYYANYSSETRMKTRSAELDAFVVNETVATAAAGTRPSPYSESMHWWVG